MKRDDVPETSWRGRALGAAASLKIVGLEPEAAGRILTDVQGEILRLEAIFSLYRTDSLLALLNAKGRIDTPPFEFLEVLRLCDSLHNTTHGAFDPTVQPLFDMAALAAVEGRNVSATQRRMALARVGWDAVRFDPSQVLLERTGAALTLNGIAQGYITDRISRLLRERGLTDVLIDMGEIAALGQRPDGSDWRAAIAGPQGQIVRRLRLSGRALATSAPKGTILDPAGKIGHIFHPIHGTEADAASLVSVSARDAALADGLSTAFCAMSDISRSAALTAFPDARVEVIA